MTAGSLLSLYVYVGVCVCSGHMCVCGSLCFLGLYVCVGVCVLWAACMKYKHIAKPVSDNINSRKCAFVCCSQTTAVSRTSL